MNNTPPEVTKMKKLIWKVSHCYWMCRELKSFKFWIWWSVADASIENDPDCLDYPARDVVLEELSYWQD